MAFENYTRDQLMIIATFVVVNFCNALCASMQAPFYPREAVSKGLKVWHFGLVFGAFELTVFSVSPLIGTFLNKLGVKRTLNIGIASVGVVLIFYGLLGQLRDGGWFLGLSFVLRIIEACGNSAFLTGSFSAIAREFPDRVATMFALIELFFGIGMIVGPMIGGALYEVGGFTLPFDIMGSILVVSAIFIFFVLPEIGRNVTTPAIQTEKPSVKMVVTRPSILIALYSVLTGAASLGFLQTTLEPHLSDPPTIPLSSFQVGTLFMVVGGSYGLSLPFWGFMCDSTCCRNAPKYVEIVGAIAVGCGFVILGPFPYLPFKKTLVSIIIGMTLHGIGLGASVVGGFADAHKSAIASGFPDTIDTYGLISGLWTSVFAFGAFIGPTVGGVLYSAVTFEWAILLVIVMEVISLIFLITFLLCSCRSRDPYAELDEESNTVAQERDSYGSTDNGLLPPSPPARATRKYSESVPGSYMGGAMARSMSKSMSVARPTGFMSAGLGVGSIGGARISGRETEPLIA